MEGLALFVGMVFMSVGSYAKCNIRGFFGMALGLFLIILAALWMGGR